jgi:hypothetical protein
VQSVRTKHCSFFLFLCFFRPADEKASTHRVRELQANHQLAVHQFGVTVGGRSGGVEGGGDSAKQSTLAPLPPGSGGGGLGVGGGGKGGWMGGGGGGGVGGGGPVGFF